LVDWLLGEWPKIEKSRQDYDVNDSKESNSRRANG